MDFCGCCLATALLDFAFATSSRFAKLLVGVISRVGVSGNLPSSIFQKMTSAVVLLVVSLSASLVPAQQPPLQLRSNYFVTGDYVVAGWANKQIDANRPGYASGTITVPDNLQPNAAAVPTGAEIVAAYLYWATVEGSQSGFAGQNAYFRGYAISGLVLGNPNAPVSWSSGGCSGNANGSKTMRIYLADVRPYLPVDVKGIVQANNSYFVELADSGSNGNTAPFTLGATLVIVYRVLSPNFPLNAIVFFDGAFAPSNGSTTMTQAIQGFYQPAGSPVA